MAADLRTGERNEPVLRPLELFGQNAARRVQLDAVDIFDVAQPAPSRHQLVGCGPSVLVAEDHRIANPLAARRRLDAVPHEQRDVAESRNRPRPCVDQRTVCACRVLTRSGGDDVEGAETGGDFRRHRHARGINRERQLVCAGSERTERQRIHQGVVAARHHDVLRVTAVDGELQDRSFPAGNLPRAATALC